MERFISTETLIIELLLVASLVAILVRRLRVPYTVALVLVGLVLTLQQPLELSLTPELILALLVPPLVFEAAFHINFTELRRNLPGILLLAVVGVILSTLIVGGAVSLVTPLSLPIALVFGALISATDPVAVVALFRALGAPRRLAQRASPRAVAGRGYGLQGQRSNHPGSGCRLPAALGPGSRRQEGAPTLAARAPLCLSGSLGRPADLRRL